MGTIEPYYVGFNFLCNGEKKGEDGREGAHSHTYSKRLYLSFRLLQSTSPSNLYKLELLPYHTSAFDIKR